MIVKALLEEQVFWTTDVASEKLTSLLCLCARRLAYEWLKLPVNSFTAVMLVLCDNKWRCVSLELSSEQWFALSESASFCEVMDYKLC